MITVKDKKGNFLNLLRGLFKIIHYKGKDLSFIIADNLLILQKSLDGLIFDDPSEDYKLLVMQVKEIAKSEEPDSQDRIKQLEEENSDIIKKREDQLEETRLKLDAELEIDLYPITKDLLPEDIDAEILLHIKQLIK
tara:strand:- start:176 stop:586 length:411 start_codon:yes stop_codon:yes gene_type:complete